MGKVYAVYLSLVFFSILSIVQSQTDLDTLNATRPCDHANAIRLPQDKKCLVPIKEARTWSAAAKTCEAYGGSLYETPDARIASRPDLVRCLSDMSDYKYADMWLNAVGLWSPHFFWINGTWLNAIDFCTRQTPPRDTGMVPLTSNTLSVDYCVSTCHDSGSRYIVMDRATQIPECYCKKELATQYQIKCRANTVDFTDTRAYYIVHSKEDSLIKIRDTDAFTRTLILCATVNSKTLKERQMQSGTCFTKNQFICCLGEAARCVNTNCFGPVCRFLMKDKCMLRVAINYSWYAARAYCVNEGGDLWNMHEFDEMTQVNQHLEDNSQYWIGATNYGWTFNGTMTKLGNLAFNDTVRVRCGHMFRETTDSVSSSSWSWSDAECNQEKAFLCQFNTTDFTKEELAKDVICPWVVPVDPTNTTIVSNISLPQRYTGVGGSEGFPIAGIIAAILAGIILLTCICLACACCSRSTWMSGRWRGVRERLAFIPYFANVPFAEYEGHGGMSSVSEHGSQVGLVKGEYHNAMSSGFAMSSSYAEQSGMFASKSMDQRNLESMDRRMAASNNYVSSGNTSAEERGFAAANSTMSMSARDYMTLQAQMNILDDVEVAALRESFRRKPEVSLVTDNVDMNFTVNQVSQGQSQMVSELSRASAERTMDGIIVSETEGGITLSLPERVVEEAKIYSTLKSTYNV
uniref:C-type lectin domain-containing protein n=1 Tax=Arion vulgaris TaxID=1028688 RepID=A0A0B7AH34_9EUPU